MTRQMNIKNRTYYFYNDLINIKDFDARLLKLDKKTSMELGIYYIGYITKKSDYKINSVNYIIDGFAEEKKGDKYLNTADTDDNSEALKIFRSMEWD